MLQGKGKGVVLFDTADAVPVSGGNADGYVKFLVNQVGKKNLPASGYFGQKAERGKATVFPQLFHQGDNGMGTILPVQGIGCAVQGEIRIVPLF